MNIIHVLYMWLLYLSNRGSLCGYLIAWNEAPRQRLSLWCNIDVYRSLCLSLSKYIYISLFLVMCVRDFLSFCLSLDLFGCRYWDGCCCCIWKRRLLWRAFECTEGRSTELPVQGCSINSIATSTTCSDFTSPFRSLTISCNNVWAILHITMKPLVLWLDSIKHKDSVLFCL